MVRNDIEQIHLALKIMNKNISDKEFSYLISADTITYLDIMVYNELS